MSRWKEASTVDGRLFSRERQREAAKGRQVGLLRQEGVCLYVSFGTDSFLFQQHRPTGSSADPPRGNSCLTMKEVEELEKLTQKLMKDMEHPPPAEAATSGAFPQRTAVGLRLWWVSVSPNPFRVPLTELCGFCRKPLSRTQPAVRALDCLFHVECFTCFKCEKQLQGQQFYNVDEKPFCEDCYAVSHGDECCWRELRLLWLLSCFPFLLPSCLSVVWPCRGGGLD